MPRLVSLGEPKCVHYRLGRCLHGLDDPYYSLEGVRCQEVARLFTVLEGGLDDLEAIGLTEGEAFKELQERFADALHQSPRCRRPRQNGNIDPLACGYLHGETCLLALPRCAGACAHVRTADEGAPREP